MVLSCWGSYSQSLQFFSEGMPSFFPLSSLIFNVCSTLFYFTLDYGAEGISTCSVVTAGTGLPEVPSLVLSLPHAPHRGSGHHLGLEKGRQFSQGHLPDWVSGLRQSLLAWSPLPWEWHGTAAPAIPVPLSWQKEWALKVFLLAKMSKKLSTENKVKEL